MEQVSLSDLKIAGMDHLSAIRDTRTTCEKATQALRDLEAEWIERDRDFCDYMASNYKRE